MLAVPTVLTRTSLRGGCLGGDGWVELDTGLTVDVVDGSQRGALKIPGAAVGGCVGTERVEDPCWAPGCSGPDIIKERLLALYTGDTQGGALDMLGDGLGDGVDAG